MLIDLARRAGNALVVERIEATVDFEGGAAEEAVLALTRVLFGGLGRDRAARETGFRAG